MALTREQADRIKIDEETIVGFSGTGGDVCAEQLAKWAYRRLETWPDLLAVCRNIYKQDEREDFLNDSNLRDLTEILNSVGS